MSERSDRSIGLMGLPSDLEWLYGFYNPVLIRNMPLENFVLLTKNSHTGIGSLDRSMPDTAMDFLLDHEIGEMSTAYKSVQYESLKKMYLDREHLLSISRRKVDAEEIERKVEAKVEERNRQLQRLVNGLSAENLELKTAYRKSSWNSPA